MKNIHKNSFTCVHHLLMLSAMKNIFYSSSKIFHSIPYTCKEFEIATISS